MQQIKVLLKTHKILLFPAVLLLLLLCLTALRISGTSIGIYHQYLYGDTSRDPNLLFGHPQSIRSDEWLVNTQITISQSQHNFPLINPGFTDGKDMSVTFDVPYREWSVLFKPQLLSFFVLPLEFAFAFKWWFMLFALLVSAYFFVLKLLPGKITLAIFTSIIIGCSPFVFWWYQTDIMAYGFLIMLASMSIIDRTRLRFFRRTLSQKVSIILKTVTLSYLLIAFAFTLYPPFQIPVALIVFAFLLGYFIQQRKGKLKKYLTRAALPFIVALGITGAACGTFIAVHSDAVKTIASTVYPGKRSVNAGGYDIKKLLVTYLQPQLQRGERGAKYDLNQSESSNFIVLPLFFIAPAFALLVWIRRKEGVLDWTLVTLLSCLGLFALHLLIPQATPLTKLFLLSYVPQSRLIIGLGFIAVILLTYMIHLVVRHKLIFTRKAILVLSAYSFAFFLLMVWAGFETANQYPDFISSKKLVIVLAAILASGLFLVIINRLRAGLFILAAFSIGSIILVNPFYVGLGPFYNSQVSSKIESLSKENDTWAAANNIVIENLPQISDRRAITGVVGYPSNVFWKANSGMSNDFVYNRYAHVFMTSNDADSLLLLGPDLFAVSAGCERKINSQINYIVSTAPLSGTCDHLVDTLTYPQMTFYFYQVIP